MNSIYGREVGVTGRLRDIERLVWIDLTAGDGIPEDGLDWRRNCSPGINAYHAIHSSKPVDVTLFEIQPATFDRLLASMEANLPAIGYERVDAYAWRYRDHVALRLVCGSGADADVAWIRRSDAVLVSNDPNAITTWAMRPTFAQEIEGRSWCFRSISTMGCNPAGLKRLDPDSRAGWFDLIKQQEAALPPHRDLLLAAIDGDAAQWAYLLSEPQVWRDNGTVDKTVDSAFRQYGYELDKAWRRVSPAAFSALKERLFLTASERSGR